MSTAVALEDARAEQDFGGKAVALGAAIRAGLPVPEGFALDASLVDALARGDDEARALLEEPCARLVGPLAVRSSAVGEDSAAASFAGQHASVLGVQDAAAAAEAVRTVWRSAHTESALAYRERVGADGSVRIGAVIQRLVDAETAGVLFSCNPMTGDDELVIEASWGLGEAIVQGLVIPDLFRVGRTGTVLACRPGSKTIAVRRRADGDTGQEPVAPELVEQLCLNAAELHALCDLVARCDRVFSPGPHDIEWAFESGRLALLQRRPITHRRSQLA
jgi:pyruvate,water dikinase